MRWGKISRIVDVISLVAVSMIAMVAGLIIPVGPSWTVDNLFVSVSAVNRAVEASQFPFHTTFTHSKTSVNAVINSDESENSFE